MHFAVMLAVQLVLALTDARSWHAIFASTPHVAWQEALHWLWQLSWLSVVQFEPQASSHFAAHMPPH
jgi:hypothetical protein